MKRLLLFFATSLLLATGVAWGQTATITSPTTGSTVSSCGFNVTVAAISPAPGDGRDYKLRIRYRRMPPAPEAPQSRTTIFSPSFNGSGTNFGPYTVAIPASGNLEANSTYEIDARYEVDSDGEGNWILYGTAQTITITTGPAPGSPNPTITFPANNATGVSLTPTITVAAYAACGTLTTAVIEVDSGSAATPADWLNPNFQATVDNSGNGPFTWAVSSALKGNASYQVRVRFNTSAGLVGTTIHTFTTTTPPTATITSPLNNATGISPCGFTMNIAAITPAPGDGRLYRVRARYKLASGSYTPAQTVFQPLNGSDSNFGPYTVPIPISGQLTPSASYDVEAIYQVFNSVSGNFDNYGVAQTHRITTGPIPDPSPVVTAPANNATNVSRTPTITVAAFAGCGNLTSATIEIDNGSPSAPANWTGASYQTTTFNSSNGPFTWNPPTALNSNTSYQIRVIFSNASGPLDTTVTTFRTINTDPILNSPAELSTINLCSDLPLSITPNNAAATNIEVSIFNNDPRFLVGGPYVVPVTAGQEFNPLTVTIPRSVLDTNKQYLLEIKAVGAGNSQVGIIYPTLRSPAIDPTAVVTNTPLITAPADGSTVNSFTPVIQIQSPFRGCRLDSVRYEILVGNVGDVVVPGASNLYTTPTYTWTVPVFLIAGATYRARVTYYTANGTFSDTNLFNVSLTPDVTVTSPLPLTNLNPCGFPVTVARYPLANAVRAEVRRTSGTTPDPAFGPLAGNTAYPDAALVYSAQSAGDYTFNFGNTRLQPGESYEMRIVAGTVAAGTFDPIEGSEATFAFTTGNIPNTVAPTLTLPTDGETGVSRTPTFTIDPYTGDCGALVDFSVTVVPIGTPNGFNAGEPAVKLFFPNTADFNLATRSLTVRLQDSLLAGTTYKARIQRRTRLNGKDLFDGNYDVADNDPNVYTFTTLSPFETKFDLATSEANIVGGVIYLNSLVQTIRLTSVSSATGYEIQLSTDSTFATVQYTATSPTTTFTFNANAPGLESSTRYFIRARVSQPFVGAWTSTPNIRSFVNSLHPSYADRPVGNISSNAISLRGWHVRNATSMFFQLATDPGFTNIVTAPGPYGPVAVDPANGQANVHERYSYRRWVGSSLVNVPIANASDAGFAPFNTLGQYEYVRFLVPGQTYYLRVKNVRQAPDGTYLQTGYWANVAAFTPALVARTHTITLLGAPSAVPVNLVDNFAYIQTNPQNTWNVLERQVEISTDAGFNTIVLTRSDFGGGPGFSLNTTLNFSTNYFMRVRSRAANDPNGSAVFTDWSSTFAFRTMDPTGGRVAAAAMSEDGSQLVQTVAFPNPFVENIAISVKSSHKAVTLSLVDASGRVVDKAQTLGGYTVLLGKKQLAKGLYLIRITDENGLLETLKVVKQ